MQESHPLKEQIDDYNSLGENDKRIKNIKKNFLMKRPIFTIIYSKLG